MELLNMFMVYGPSRKPYATTLAPDSGKAVERFMFDLENSEYVTHGWDKALADGFRLKMVKLQVVVSED